MEKWNREGREEMAFPRCLSERMGSSKDKGCSLIFRANSWEWASEGARTVCLQMSFP